MSARLLIVSFIAVVGLAVSTGSALDDGHGGHAPAKANPPKQPAAAVEHGKQEPAKPAAAPAKAPAEFGLAAGTPRKESAAKPMVDAVNGPVSADDALALLRAGNARWVENQPANPASDTGRRRTTALEGQHPFATILTCADSRLPVERIFDRGVGELFVLRVAGNVVGTNEAGTIEYSAEHLNVPLLVVMGHTRCGAVAAASASNAGEGHEVPPNIAGLLASIEPAVARARKADPTAEDSAIAAAAVRENVWQSIFDLIRFSGPVRAQLREGKLKIVGAVCDVNDGQVTWLGEHPWQEELVHAFDARSEKSRPAVATVPTESSPVETVATEQGH